MAAGHPPYGRATPQTAVWGLARPQGVEGSGMAGWGKTLGSPWIPLPVRACQRDAEWIVIRRSLWGHNDTPCGRTIGRPGAGRPQGVFGGLSYYQLVKLISSILF
jgi:hypothetical protein